MGAAELAGLNPFGIFDVEAARLDHFFSDSTRPTGTGHRNARAGPPGDVLSHLIGRELYNHARLNGDLQTLPGFIRTLRPVTAQAPPSANAPPLTISKIAGAGHRYCPRNPYCSPSRGVPV
jgi:hypothetical protein